MCEYGTPYKVKPEFLEDKRLLAMRKTLRDVYQEKQPNGKRLALPSKGFITDCLALVLTWIMARPRSLSPVDAANAIDRVAKLDGFAFSMHQAGLMTVLEDYVRIDLSIGEPALEGQNQ